MINTQSVKNIKKDKDKEKNNDKYAKYKIIKISIIKREKNIRKTCFPLTKIYICYSKQLAKFIIILYLQENTISS